MRLLCFFLLFSLTYLGIAQNNLKFDESSFETIIKKSKEEQKPVLLMLYANWCPHCAKMKNEVLTDPKVINLLDENYICAKQETDGIEGKLLKTKFDITSLPTFILLNSNENELYRLKGEYKTADFITEINNALNPKLQLPFLEKEFLLDPSNTQNWLNYMNVLKKGRERNYLATKASPYFATQSDNALISAINWQIISNCVTDISSREFQYVLHHKKEFEAVSSPLRVERKIVNIVSELLKPLAENLDTISYSQQRKIAKTIQLQKTDSLIFRYDLMIYERAENWKEYENTTLESTEKYAWNDISLLKEISQIYLKQVAALPSLKKAIKWTTRSLAVNDSYDGNLLLSKLYLKTNDKKTALIAARKAKMICTAYNFNSKDIDELYLKLGITK